MPHQRKRPAKRSTRKKKTTNPGKPKRLRVVGNKTTRFNYIVEKVGKNSVRVRKDVNKDGRLKKFKSK